MKAFKVWEVAGLLRKEGLLLQDISPGFGQGIKLPPGLVSPILARLAILCYQLPLFQTDCV